MEIVGRNAAIARYADGGQRLRLSAGRAPVLANRTILSQVIDNLFGIAAKAIAAGAETDRGVGRAGRREREGPHPRRWRGLRLRDGSGAV